MNPAELHRHAHALRAAYLDTLGSLVGIESPSRDREASNRLADALEAQLHEGGWAVERHVREHVGDNLVARKGMELGGTKTLLLTHYDTVWPLGTTDKRPFQVDGDMASGPGTLDMKAGIATALHAVQLVEAQAALRGPVTLMVTSDEETGSEHSRALIESEALTHNRVLVLEPSRDDGALKVGRKGVAAYEVAFAGVSAHAGLNPELGASALRELAHFLPYAEGLTRLEEGTTVNLTVAAGGTTGNVIAAHATATLDVRVSHLGEAERVDAALRAYRPEDGDVTVTVDGGVNRPPMEANAANTGLYEEAKAIGAAMGVTFESCVVGGGSDGNFTSALGVPTLDGLGSVGKGSHAEHEHIRIPGTLDRLAAVAGFLSTDGA
jgi:glutamate carboxypeptidase